MITINNTQNIMINYCSNVCLNIINGIKMAKKIKNVSITEKIYFEVVL